jgi:hypothetical protein
VTAPPDPVEVLRADLDGVMLTRYPPGLLAALEKIGATAEHGDAAAGWGVPPSLWLISPGEQLLTERLEALREL